MRFLVDTQLPVALAHWLREQGYEATHVLEIDLAQGKDELIWQHAREHEAIVVTKDEDFAEWIRRGRPGPQVVWLRFGNSSRSATLSRLNSLWPAILGQLQLGERLVEVR